MNAETVWDRSSTYTIAVLIAVILILIFIILRTEKPAPIDPHRITVTFDDENRISLLDADGKRAEPIELDEKDPLGSAFKEGLPRELHGTSALILGFPENPSCNPTIIIGNSCSAPHRRCCY